MRVAETEMAFVFARDLPARAAPYELDEVMQAGHRLHHFVITDCP